MKTVVDIYLLGEDVNNNNNNSNNNENSWLVGWIVRNVIIPLDF